MGTTRTNASYGVLRTLRKLKYFTDRRLRKRLAESLVLSKLDYCYSVYSPLPAGSVSSRGCFGAPAILSVVPRHLLHGPRLREI